MSRVLVTGGNGFIGRHCLPLLVAIGHDVHAVSRQKPAIPLPAVTWHEFDLLLPGAPASVIRTVKPEYLLHLAWYAIPGKFWEAPENNMWVNASRELFTAFAASKGKRVVGAGSCAEYANNSGECFERQTPLVPSTLYGKCKQETRGSLDSICRQAGVRCAWGRIFFLYGPFEPSSRLVAYAVQSLLRGEPALCSNGGQELDFLHVADVASAFVALLESGVDGPVNIGSGGRVKVRDVLLEIGAQTGKPELIRLGARESSSDVSRMWANAARLLNEVGWKPRYDLKSGIQQTIEWWRNSTKLSALERA